METRHEMARLHAQWKLISFTFTPFHSPPCTDVTGVGGKKEPVTETTTTTAGNGALLENCLKGHGNDAAGQMCQQL